MNRLAITIISVFLLLTSFATLARAQSQNWDAGRPQLTRTELNDLLVRLEELSQSSAYTGEMRSQAREEAAMVRARLDAGDIRVGDQISLVVEREDSLSSTLTVRPGEVITLRGIGDIAVRGVLRSELEEHLRRELAKFIRDPVVHAHSLVRVTISGSVARPGFYAVQAEQLLSDAIMTAGGPAGTADLNKMYIERAGERIWEGRYLQQAIADGRTLDQLSLQAGDQIVVPAQAAGASTRVLGFVTGAASIVALLVTIFR